jgi:hypothetical protein
VISAGRVVLVVAEMLTDLGLQRGLQHPLGQLVQQSVRADQLDPLLLRLRQQTLGELLLIHRCRRLRRHLLCCCHVVDRVSHGLSPLGSQTSQFNRSADSPQQRGDCRLNGGLAWAVIRETVGFVVSEAVKGADSPRMSVTTASPGHRLGELSRLQGIGRGEAVSAGAAALLLSSLWAPEDVRVTSVGIGWLRASDPYFIPRTRSQRCLP